MDRQRSDIARANAENAASGIYAQDYYANANNRLQSQALNQDTNLAYRRLDEQRRQSAWDSSFNNLTAAWGALAGLLR